MLLGGAIRGLLSLPATQLTQSEEALIAAREHIFAVGDSRARTDYTYLLSKLKDPRARQLLWELAAQGEQKDQALIAITWRKDPADLPRLAAVMAGRGNFVTMPNLLRYNYGEAAIPYLQDAIAKSPEESVRFSCARELLAANRASAIAFFVDAMENNRPFKQVVLRFLKDQFAAVRAVDDDAVILAWLKQRGK